MRACILALLLMLPAVPCLTACGGEAAGARVRLVTTTSTENSGLLAHLLAAYAEVSGDTVQVIAVGTGEALRRGAAGDADLLMVHAREREEAFLAAGHGERRLDLMWNDFVLVGPAEDPAGVRGLTDVAQAFAAIAGSKASFASRGDDSGTHTRELSLWETAGVDVRGRLGNRYKELGQGMGATLRFADEKDAYTLTDRGTWLAWRGEMDLEILVQGDTRLRNPYGLLLLSKAKHPELAHEAAGRLADWLVSEPAQRLIAEFRVGGERLFHPVHPAVAEGP